MKTATYRFLAVGSLLWTLCAFVPNAAAQSPKEQLQGTIDRVIEILRTISSPQDIEKHKTSLRRLLIARFDFAAMAQKSLGRRWSDLAGDEQAFVATFTDFVQHGYMSTLGSYRGEKVVYDSERLAGESAEVDTRVVGGEGTPIRIQYKLNRRGAEWMVYDAVVDDVSVVENYRSQFSRILRTSSVKELTENLRAKTSGP